MVVLELGLGNYQAASSLVLGRLEPGRDVRRPTCGGRRRGLRSQRQQRAPRRRRWRTWLNAPRSIRAILIAGSSLAAGPCWPTTPERRPSYRESIDALEACGAGLHLARSQLVYGEWLRRQKRRRDARRSSRRHASVRVDGRQRLRRAGQSRAAGDRSACPQASGRDAPRPHAAGMADRPSRGGWRDQSRDRARLFISANTVDYHLRKVYRKLDIKSRHELASVVPLD